MDDKKKRKKMPSAPIKAPQGTIKGIGKKGITTGGLVPTLVAPKPGQGAYPNPGTGAAFMRGYLSNSLKGIKRQKG